MKTDLVIFAKNPQKKLDVKARKHNYGEKTPEKQDYLTQESVNLFRKNIVE